MAFNLRFPYRESREGLWGEHTSTLNWCEEDYNVTYYCAEFVNTITNASFLYLAVKGIRNCLRYSHPPIYILGYLGFMVVGLGSIAFHSTLKYSMQLADELPMIYTTCIMAFAALSYGRSPRAALLVALGLLTLAASITAYYLYAKDPVFHQVAYAILMLSTITRGMYVMEYLLRPALRQRSPNECDAILRDMWAMATTGVTSFLIGFFLWNMDNIYCHEIRSWRNNYLMLPWGMLLEGHAWWHIFTGIAYYFITWRVWIHRCLDKSEDKFYLHWPSAFTSVPEIRAKSDRAAEKKTQ